MIHQNQQKLNPSPVPTDRLSYIRRVLPVSARVLTGEGFLIFGGPMHTLNQIRNKQEVTKFWELETKRYEDRKITEDARRFEEYTQKDVAQALARRGF